MSESTIIAWTDHTFNAWMGCAKISVGCANCYAERLTRDRMGLQLWGPQATRQVTSSANWRKPLQWNRQAATAGQRRKVFCGSLMDWSEDHPTAAATRPRLWELIRATPNLDWQLLTKRTERIKECLPRDWEHGYQNVWLGTTIEDDRYTWRARELAEIPAAVRFVSYEPALGPLPSLNLDGIDWLICGGESGPGYRIFDQQWARDVEAACRESNTAFFFKQSSGWRTEMGTELDGRIIKEYPVPRVCPRPRHNA